MPKIHSVYFSYHPNISIFFILKPKSMKNPLLLLSLLISGITSSQYLESKDFLLNASAGLINYNFHLQGECALA